MERLKKQKTTNTTINDMNNIEQLNEDFSKLVNRSQIQLYSALYHYNFIQPKSGEAFTLENTNFFNNYKSDTFGISLKSNQFLELINQCRTFKQGTFPWTKDTVIDTVQKPNIIWIDFSQQESEGVKPVQPKVRMSGWLIPQSHLKDDQLISNDSKSSFGFFQLTSPIAKARYLSIYFTAAKRKIVLASAGIIDLCLRIMKCLFTQQGNRLAKLYLLSIISMSAFDSVGFGSRLEGELILNIHTTKSLSEEEIALCNIFLPLNSKIIEDELKEAECLHYSGIMNKMDQARLYQSLVIYLLHSLSTKEINETQLNTNYDCSYVMVRMKVLNQQLDANNSIRFYLLKV
ncbi:unnamed protein product [Schistosoma curassoni]|uniref:Uncharacterized protein n=1 Tax=Schistosoma curassoni TaxID=6186 RepID=A0A183KP40_9TREM|nr:unnamed protein product [Schistosoma curassoni]